MAAVVSSFGKCRQRRRNSGRSKRDHQHYNSLTQPGISLTVTFTYSLYIYQLEICSILSAIT